MDIIKIFQEKMSQNSYLVVEGEDAILIDGGAFVGSIEENLKVFSPKPKIKAVFLTHAHFDHIAELDNIVSKYKCPVYIYKLGKPMLYDEKKNLSFIDTPFKIKEKKGVKTFVDGEELTFGGITIKCFNTPGHSVDSSCFVIDDNMFTGDTVFKIEVGRTDMYSGDENVQMITLERIMNTLSEGISHYYPGHGSNFTYEDLKYNLNRFLGDI
jgi:glyoxylase-like metal-dependent hydrolase (beta-lactamase superfamily II)